MCCFATRTVSVHLLSHCLFQMIPTMPPTQNMIIRPNWQIDDDDDPLIPMPPPLLVRVLSAERTIVMPDKQCRGHRGIINDSILRDTTC